MDLQNSRSRTDFVESRKEARALKSTFLGLKQTARIACWNVRNLYQMRKTQQLAREMRRYKVDIGEISENRWTKSGKINLTTGEVYSDCCIQVTIRTTREEWKL